MTYTELEREMRQRGDTGTVYKVFALMRTESEFSDHPVEWNSPVPDWARAVANI